MRSLSRCHPAGQLGLHGLNQGYVEERWRGSAAGCCAGPPWERGHPVAPTHPRLHPNNPSIHPSIHHSIHPSMYPTVRHPSTHQHQYYQPEKLLCTAP